MRSFTNWVKALFAKKKENTYYCVIVQANMTDENVGKETYIAGFLFENEKDAWRHANDCDQYNQDLHSVGILEVKTDLPVTVAKLDYTRTKEHPSPTVTFQEVKSEQ